MDITARKLANLALFQNFIRPDEVLIKIYNHTAWSTKVRNYSTFKHHFVINELVVIKF